MHSISAPDVAITVPGSALFRGYIPRVGQLVWLFHTILYA